MFSFIDHAKEIQTVSRAQHVDIGVAYDKFRADVAARAALPYNTGNALPTFDFADAKREWDSMTEEQQEIARKAWRER